MRKAEQEQSQSILTVVDADGAPARKQRIQYRVCRTGHRYKYRKIDTNRDSRSTLSVLLTKPNKPSRLPGSCVCGVTRLRLRRHTAAFGSACGEHVERAQCKPSDTETLLKTLGYGDTVKTLGYRDTVKNPRLQRHC